MMSLWTKTNITIHNKIRKKEMIEMDFQILHKLHGKSSSHLLAKKPDSLTIQVN